MLAFQDIICVKGTVLQTYYSTVLYSQLFCWVPRLTLLGLQTCSWNRTHSYVRDFVCMCMLVAQPCPTLFDHMDYSPPCCPVHGILHVRIVSRLPCPSPGDLPDTGIEPRSPALQADPLPFELPERMVVRMKWDDACEGLRIIPGT